MFLKRGKLTAKVAGRAKGFTVETPSATLVDLGTEFAADVDRDGNGEVHVFRGEVIVQPRSLTDSRPAAAERGASNAGSTPPRPLRRESSSIRAGFFASLRNQDVLFPARLRARPQALSPHGTHRRWALADRLVFAGQIRPGCAESE